MVRCFDAAHGPYTSDDDAGYAAVLLGEIERMAAAELMLLGLRYVLAKTCDARTSLDLGGLAALFLGEVRRNAQGFVPSGYYFLVSR